MYNKNVFIHRPTPVNPIPVISHDAFGWGGRGAGAGHRPFFCICLIISIMLKFNANIEANANVKCEQALRGRSLPPNPLLVGLSVRVVQ